MQISQVSCARPGGASEDYACAGPDCAVVVDGAMPVAGTSTGCLQHDDATAVYFRLADAS